MEAALRFYIIAVHMTAGIINNKEEKHYCMVRILVAYDTKYGSTENVAQWIAEGITESETSETIVDVKNISQIAEISYDCVVIGSPIYEEEPLNSVITFLEARSASLKQVSVALFVVCGDYGRLTKDQLIDTYVKKLEAHVSGIVIAREVFGGYLDLEKLSNEDRGIIEDFSKVVGHPIIHMDLLDEDKTKAFGRDVVNLL
jgi:menaquinone-dependent protoporphyrinogen oxidase